MAEVLIDYDIVRSAAGVFSTNADNFEALIGPLQTMAELLQQQSFVGAAGTQAATQIGHIQSHVQRIVQRCREMNIDLRAAIGDIQTGDQTGAELFKN